MKRLVCLLLLTAPAAAEVSSEPVTAALVMKRFEELDGRLSTLSADFRQSIRWEGSATTQSVEGRLDYRKKDRLRLEHRLPERQTVVADGESLWVWRPATNQVIKTGLKDWKRSEPLAQGLMDFGGYADLLKRYDAAVSTVQPAAAGGQRLVTLLLTPKDKKKDFALTMRLSTKDYFPYETEMTVGEISVRSVFENVRFNPELSDSLFRFAPPSGADVFVKPPKEPHGP